MRNNRLRQFLFRFVAVALLGLGFLPYSQAGVLDTQALLDRQAATDSTTRINVLLEREDVASKLVALGVDPADVSLRVASLTNAEIVELEQRLDQQVAGGDAIGVIGTVFLVLLILELVGVTDVFTGI